MLYLGKEIHSIDMKVRLSGIFYDVGINGQMYLKNKDDKISEIFSGSFVPSEKLCF